VGLATLILVAILFARAQQIVTSPLAQAASSVNSALGSNASSASTSSISYYKPDAVVAVADPPATVYVAAIPAGTVASYQIPQAASYTSWEVVISDPTGQISEISDSIVSVTIYDRNGNDLTSAGLTTVNTSSWEWDATAPSSTSIGKIVVTKNVPVTVPLQVVVLENNNAYGARTLNTSSASETLVF
jgi:hypothetical protein